MRDTIRDTIAHVVAQVVVGGAYSVQADLANMVYQGTVWGPPLWNVFFEDARWAINEVLLLSQSRTELGCSYHLAAKVHCS